MRRKRISIHDRRGAALVEMALILPVFLMVVLGIIEFGRAMMVSNLLTNAARDGARLAVVAGTTNSQVTSAVNQFLTESVGSVPDGTEITVTVTEATGNPATENDVSKAIKRDLCTINVTVPFSKVSLIPGKYLNNVSLKGHCAMRHE